MTKFSQIPRGAFFKPSESNDHFWMKIEVFFLEGYYFNAVSHKGVWFHIHPDNEVIYYPNATVNTGEEK